MPDDYAPLRQLFESAYAELDPRLLSCIQTADMLIVPSSHITSKGAVDRSRYLRYPPLLWKEFALGHQLFHQGFDATSGDALVLEWHHKLELARRARQAEGAPSAASRLANTQALLKEIGL